MAVWQVKQETWLTLWLPDMIENAASPEEHRALCSASGNLSGLIQEGVEIVPAWHLRQESESLARARSL